MEMNFIDKIKIHNTLAQCCNEYGMNYTLQPDEAQYFVYDLMMALEKDFSIKDKEQKD